jgi:hypothetical protein
MIRLQVLAATLAVATMAGCGGVTKGQTTTTPASPNATIPVAAKTIAAIQKQTNWSSCSSDCSGQPGTDAVYSMEQGIATPSQSGSAIKFDITGGTPWATALWWKQVGGDDTKTHFVYELSFYLTNPAAAQALEFNVNQNAGGWRYEYATQCDIRGGNSWRIWDHAGLHWVATSAPCPTPQANAWNNLTWEFERTSDHKVVFVAVTLNGQRSEINESLDGFTASGSGIDVAFQMDSDGVPTPWSVWVDSVNLSEW